jgi:glucosamine-6-phosphate deaminase
MKLSFSTLGCPDWSLPRVIDMAGRAGYDGIELRFLEGDDALWQRPELTTGLAESRRRFDDAGLVVSCVDSRSFFHDPDPSMRRAAQDEVFRIIDLAAELGAPGVRVFGDRVQPGGDLDRTAGWIAEAVRVLADRARPAGIGIWLETHGDFAPGARACAVVDEADRDNVGVVWDPANAFSEFGEEPEDGAGALGSAIRHVHLKDEHRPAPRSRQLPWTPALPGTGAFPATRVLLILARSGYRGFVSFEWEKKWHPKIDAPEIALPHFVRWVVQSSRADSPPPPPGRGLSRGRLAAEVHPNRATMGRAAAHRVSEQIKRAIARDGLAPVIFASAPSQNEFLAALREDPSIEWRRVIAFHLDEYVGVGMDHSASFRRFLTDRLFDRVAVRAFHGLDGQAPDLDAECARYAALLQRERPVLAILGIGENGHLAFIDPPSCDFQDRADVRVVELDTACRNQQVHDGAFARLEDVPARALSLTIPFLMRVPAAVAIVPGPAKRKAIKAALDGPVTRDCPASILRRHPDVSVFLDEDSAAELLS